MFKQYKDTDYYISSSGRVFRDGQEVGFKTNGRIMVRLGKKGRTLFRAKMVAETFLDYEEGQEVHHINGIRDDDRPENLICLTPLQHHRIHGRDCITLQYDKEWNLLHIYNSTKDAAIAIGLNACNQSKITRAVQNNRLANGFYWYRLEYLPEEFIFVSENETTLKERFLQYIVGLNIGGRRFGYYLRSKKRPVTLLEGIHFK